LVHLIEPSEFDELFMRPQPPRLRIKVGFDPTSSELHLGHAVLLRKLRQFQDLGHTVVFIIGGMTASIGDPTGRNATRPPLTPEQIAENAATYVSQACKILNRDLVVVRNNNDWFMEMNMKGLIKLTSNFTIAQMLQRNEFATRFAAKEPIHLHEILYPLFQAYDSYWEMVDIEFGGTDQLFNLMVGRDYMRLRNEKPQIVATVPLLVGTDGVNKMSKSYGNHISLTDSPYDMFAKTMSIPDSLMDQWESTLFPSHLYLPASAFFDSQCSVRRFDAETNPMSRKKVLAWRVVNIIYTEDEAHTAKDEWTRIFSEGKKPSDIKTLTINIDSEWWKTDLRLDRLVYMAGLADSVSEANRLTKSGAVEVDGVKITNPRFSDIDPTAEIRVGRKWVKLEATNDLVRWYHLDRCLRYKSFFRPTRPPSLRLSWVSKRNRIQNTRISCISAMTRSNPRKTMPLCMSAGA
jgi:tyrosyl-tRNA synthetase